MKRFEWKLLTALALILIPLAIALYMRFVLGSEEVFALGSSAFFMGVGMLIAMLWDDDE